MSKASKDAGQKIEELTSQLQAEKAEKSQLDQELIQSARAARAGVSRPGAAPDRN